MRALCAEHDVLSACDQEIGQLLSRARADNDGLWPCRPVCTILESVASSDMQQGFVIGTINSRGVVFHGGSGDQEREIAEAYRHRAQRVAFEFPKVAGVVNRIAKSYEGESQWWDAESQARQMLGC